MFLIRSCRWSHHMKQVPGLLAFQQADDDACAAWLIEMRWPDGFVCPACGHEKGWALRRKAHTFECAGCRRQTSVTAGTILHASKLPLTVWFWAAYLRPTPTASLPCSSRSSSVSALTAALGCSPTSCAARPRAQPVVGPGGNRRGQPSIRTKGSSHRRASARSGGDGNIPGRNLLLRYTSSASRSR